MIQNTLIVNKGIDTSDATATASDVLSGKTFYANGAKLTGNILSQAAQIITPGTADKIISAGKYLSGTQTIKGDANLIAANIKSGASIFGVARALNAGFVTQVQGSGTSYIRIPGLTSVPNYIMVFAHTMINVLNVMQACYFSKSATIDTLGFNFLQLYCNSSGNSTFNLRGSTIGLVSSSELEDGAGYYYDSSAFYLCITSGRIFDSATTYTCLAG